MLLFKLTFPWKNISKTTIVSVKLHLQCKYNSTTEDADRAFEILLNKTTVKYANFIVNNLIQRLKY